MKIFYLFSILNFTFYLFNFNWRAREDYRFTKQTIIDSHHTIRDDAG
jgi:hypothetical protein